MSVTSIDVLGGNWLEVFTFICENIHSADGSVFSLCWSHIFLLYIYYCSNPAEECAPGLPWIDNCLT